MLSILIPTYNYNVLPLVTQIQKQVSLLKFEYEIIVFEDCSTLKIIENQQINSIENSTYKLLDKNIGRSKIRNLLAKSAKYNWLLFLDADVIPEKDNFISKYLDEIKRNEKERIIYGGIVYTKEKPKKEFVFRWKYGNQREAKSLPDRIKNKHLSLLTLNFLSHKNIFKKVLFNETILNLRHEDTLFSFDLKKQNINVEHIENRVIHLGLDSFEKAIKKENDSIISLNYLLKNDLIDVNYLKITKIYTLICRLKLDSIILFLYNFFKLIILENLRSNNPNLVLFDFYRLGYLCELNKK